MRKFNITKESLFAEFLMSEMDIHDYSEAINLCIEMGMVNIPTNEIIACIFIRERNNELCKKYIDKWDVESSFRTYVISRFPELSFDVTFQRTVGSLTKEEYLERDWLTLCREYLDSNDLTSNEANKLNTAIRLVNRDGYYYTPYMTLKVRNLLKKMGYNITTTVVGEYKVSLK